jgi:hypothetical protein
MMLAWFARDILGAFAGRILPMDERVALACAAPHVPDPKPDRDAYIAATALVHDLTIVTRNTKIFAFSGVKLFDPWARELTRKSSGPLAGKRVWRCAGCRSRRLLERVGWQKGSDLSPYRAPSLASTSRGIP